MKKEVFLAVLVGFGLGLIITFGIWTANKNLKPSSSSSVQVITPSPVPPGPDTSAGPSTGSTLVITSPAEDEVLVNSNQLTLTGKTKPGNTVAITHEASQQILVADSTGNFSQALTLESGYNRLTVMSFDSAGNSETKEILVTYSSTKI